VHEHLWPVPGNTNRGGRLGTVFLLIKVACFVKKETIIILKMSSSKILSSKRSTVLGPGKLTTEPSPLLRLHVYTINIDTSFFI
jgi:hypothetical protein